MTRKIKGKECMLGDIPVDKNMQKILGTKSEFLTKFQSMKLK